MLQILLFTMELKQKLVQDALFSTGIDFRTTDSLGIFNSDGERINQDKNIFFGEHVWIGRMVSIFKGSISGADSIIGSMFLVSDTIPMNAIAVGVPTKVIKDKICWN